VGLRIGVIAGGEKTLLRRGLLWLALAGLCLLCAGVLRFLCGTAAGDGVRHFAAVLSGLLSRCFAFSRRPVGEWLLVLVVPGIPVGLIFAAVRGGKRCFALWLCREVALCCAIFLLFLAAFGVQYTGPDLVESLALPVGGYTMEQMTRTLDTLAREINIVAPAVPRDEAGNCAFGSFESQAQAVMEAYGSIGSRVPVLEAVSPVAPKEALLLSVPMSYWGITGFFFPWTGECVVSGNNPVLQQPFTIAHESAHSRRVGNEDEANFWAYTICSASDIPTVRYSGYFSLLPYVLSNARMALSPDSYKALLLSINPSIREQFNAQQQYWREKYSPLLGSLQGYMYDLMLKGNKISSGTKNYLQVIDLIMAMDNKNTNFTTDKNILP
jgi:hypothetical protein